MTQRFLLLLLLPLLAARPAAAQSTDSRTPETSFQHLVDSFENYWKDRKPTKGSGYKQFRRWQWYWSQRLMPDGTLPPAGILQQAWQDYRKTHPATAAKSAGTTGQWHFAGPSQTPGGYNGLGRLNTVAFHPTNPDILWVGAAGGGIWKTTDGALTWTTTTDQQPVLGVSDIAVHPTAPDTLYIATGDADGQDSRSIGVLKSADGGLSWQPTGLNWSVTNGRYIRRLIMNPVNPRTLFCASSNGIYRTHDGGDTWAQVASGSYIDIEFKPNDTATLYIATNGSAPARILRSTNGGNNWATATILPYTRRAEIAVTPAAPNRVEVVGAFDSSSGLSGMWRSTDGGQSFAKYLAGDCSTNMLNGSFTGSGCRGQGFYDLTLCINPSDSNDIWVGGVINWNSLDNGQNWQPRTFWYNTSNAPTVHADKHMTVFHPYQPNVLLDCNDGGLYVSPDGGSSWMDLSNGLGISQIYRIAVAQTDTTRVLIGMQDNGSREVYQGLWYERTGGDGMDCLIDPTDGDVQYGSYVYGELYRTFNGWASKTTISDNIPGTPQGAWLTPMKLDPTDPATIYAGYKELYVSHDWGDTWQAISNGFGGRNISDFAVAPSNTAFIYVSTGSGLYRTNNSGQSWTTLTPPGSGSLSRVLVTPQDPQEVYITRSNYLAGDKIWKSIDGGNTWANISGTLPNVPANCVIADTIGGRKGLYLGTDLGVYYQNDTMTDWVRYKTGLPNATVNDLEISIPDKTLWAGTYGRGLWRTTVFDAAPQNVATTAPVADALRVYPNPASQHIGILASKSRLREVALYDGNGKLMTRYEKLFSPEFRLPVAAFPAGNYLLRITLQDGTQKTEQVAITR